MSVGSVTITETRQEHLDFTQPYYFTPAQMATTDGTGIETLDDFSGKTVCVGEGTTYFDWMEGTLTLTEDAGEVDPTAGGHDGHDASDRHQLRRGVAGRSRPSSRAG